VTARVQRQIVGLFVVKEGGSHKLKGVPEPVTLFQLVRASGGGRRAGQRRLTPLVGREEEIAMLTRRWERARQGDGQMMLIVGEPGLGKSRLIEEFHGRLRDVCLDRNCSSTWTKRVNCQDVTSTDVNEIQATGRDAKGRKQYRYNAVFREVRESTKYEHVVAFADALPAIREVVQEHKAFWGGAARKGAGDRRASSGNHAHPHRE
jgi:hypothetical protein